MRVGRVVVGAVVGLALMGACGAGAVKVRDNIAIRQQCETVKPQVAGVHVSDASPKVVILGDSYTVGDGVPQRSEGWAYAVGTELMGVSGTGYVNGGYCGNHTYGERLAGALVQNPDTLIIQGGLNDWEQDPAKVSEAANNLLGRTGAVSRVLVVGPPDVPKRDGEAAVDEALRAAVEPGPVQYVSALDWDLDYLPDGVHLTAAGHAQFAKNVARAITR